MFHCCGVRTSGVAAINCGYVAQSLPDGNSLVRRSRTAVVALKRFYDLTIPPQHRSGYCQANAVQPKAATKEGCQEALGRCTKWGCVSK